MIPQKLKPTPQEQIELWKGVINRIKKTMKTKTLSAKKQIELWQKVLQVSTNARVRRFALEGIKRAIKEGK